MTLIVFPNVAVICSIWLETIFYGGYLMLFTGTFRSLRGLGSIHLSTAVRVVLFALFCLSTAHLGVNVRRLVTGFALSNTTPQRTSFFFGVGECANALKQFLWVFINMFASGLLIWRLSRIWTIWVCIAPIIILSLTTALGFVTGASMLSASSPSISILVQSRTYRYVTAQFALSFLCSLVVSVLTFIRIYNASGCWFVPRSRIPTPGGGVLGVEGGESLGVFGESGEGAGSGAGPGTGDGCRRERRLGLLIIETAAAYTVTQFLMLVFYAARSPGLYFVADMFVQIMAIVANLIIVLIALGFTSFDETQLGDSTLTGLKFASRRPPSGTAGTGFSFSGGDTRGGESIDLAVTSAAMRRARAGHLRRSTDDAGELGAGAERAFALALPESPAGEHAEGKGGALVLDMPAVLEDDVVSGRREGRARSADDDDDDDDDDDVDHKH